MIDFELFEKKNGNIVILNKQIVASTLSISF